MKRLFLLMLPFVFASCEKEPEIATPTPEQAEWADCEVGVMFHFEIPTFNPDYYFWNHTLEGASCFNPTDLSTDQWIEVSKEFGAKYAILVAKHCTGFSLWPTKAHEFSVKNSPWKDGKGDLVKEFIESCNKYGVKPGLYASTGVNGYLNIQNGGHPREENGPCTLEEYNKIVLQQLTELWGNYGPIFEIWYDGGIVSKENGGPDVLSVVTKYQPQAIEFNGPVGYPNRIRWVGNEMGFTPDTCWATSDLGVDNDFIGNPDAKAWCPGEADFTLRYNSSYQGGWFWHEGDDDKIFSVDELIEKYEKSVGHNSNMLLGVVIDNRGRIPDADVKRMKEFAAAIKAKYGNPLKTTSGKKSMIEIDLDGDKVIDRAIIQEDITLGERVTSYKLEGETDGTWKTLYEGANIGHKRIALFEAGKYSKVRLNVLSSRGTPQIKNFSIFEK